MLPFYIPFLSGYKTGALTRSGLHSQKINFSIKDFFIFCDVLMVIFSQVEQKSSVTFQLFPKTNSSELHKNHYITAIKKTIKCFIAFGCTAYTSPTIHTSAPFFLGQLWLGILSMAFSRSAKVTTDYIFWQIWKF